MAEKGPANPEGGQEAIQGMVKQLESLIGQMQQAETPEQKAAILKKIKELLEQIRAVSPEVAANIESQLGQMLEL